MHVSINSITFSDGTDVKTNPGEIIVIVGPNNSGKSAALRGINEKLQDPGISSPVISHLQQVRNGTDNDLVSFLETKCRRIDNPPGNPRFSSMGMNVHRNSAIAQWNNPNGGLHDLLGLFCRLLSAEQRISAANAPGRISHTRDIANHPIHLLERDDRLEEKLCVYFHKAFGTDLIVHRGAGSNVPLMVGKRPIPKSGQDRVSYDYIQELEKLPQMETQGDGMRSFAGILLNIFLGEESIVLIDEPEAFLHPPQARLLGRMLARETNENRQVILATHSSDVLRGILDEPRRKVRVIRITRANGVNPVASLDSAKIQTLWNDPLLRYSNILDGLFHERVILCEADGDCRFYSAIADAIIEAKGTNFRPPDLMYAHCGGKARLAMVVRSLREVAVPVSVITDFDMLNSERPLRDLIEAAGGDWSTMERDWKIVKSAVEGKRPDLPTEDVKRAITSIFSQITTTSFPTESKNKIERVLRQSSPWSIAKETGKAYVPNGDASAAIESLFAQLRILGIHVVETGEVETFAKSIPGHGPAWVNEALKRDLQADPELQLARDFVSRILT